MSWENASLMKFTNDAEKYEIEVTLTVINGGNITTVKSVLR